MLFRSATDALRFLGSPFVQEATAESDFDLAEIVRGDFDIFVCIPPEKLEDQKQLVRLLFGIVFVEMLKAQGQLGLRLAVIGIEFLQERG